MNRDTASFIFTCWQDSHPVGGLTVEDLTHPSAATLQEMFRRFQAMQRLVARRLVILDMERQRVYGPFIDQADAQRYMRENGIDEDDALLQIIEFDS